MLQEVGTLQGLLVNRSLPLLHTGLHQLEELEVLDAAKVKLIPVFIVPGLAQWQELSLSQFEALLLLVEVRDRLWDVDDGLGEALNGTERDVGCPKDEIFRALGEVPEEFRESTEIWQQVIGFAIWVLSNFQDFDGGLVAFTRAVLHQHTSRAFVVLRMLASPCY
jgi:hypothetical protein